MNHRIAFGLLLALSGCKSKSPPPEHQAPAVAQVQVEPEPSGPPLTGVEELMAGQQHLCARVGSELFCWGASYALGGEDVARPVVLPAGVKQLAPGATFNQTCVLDSKQAVYCWGEQLSEPTVPGEVVDITAGIPSSLQPHYHPTPVRVGLPGPVSRVATGWSHACALVGKNLWCWGSDMAKAYGSVRGTLERPVKVASGVQDFSLGYHWTCFTAGKKRQCLGEAPSGFAAATWCDHMPWGNWILASCGLGKDGRVSCSGSNVGCILGKSQKELEEAPKPVDIDGVEGAQAVALGPGFGCALTQDGAVTCWGDDPRTTYVQCQPPKPVPLPDKAHALVAGNAFACAIVGDERKVSCWGSSRSSTQQVPVTPSPRYVVR